MTARLLNITLVHVGGEQRVVPVITVTESFVAIQWGMSGIYDLNLKSNTLKARSKAAQRKGSPLWSALDIALVRTQVQTHINGLDKLEQTKLAMGRHADNMPYSKGNTSWKPEK